MALNLINSQHFINIKVENMTEIAFGDLNNMLLPLSVTIQSKSVVDKNHHLIQPHNCVLQ